ncbi:thioredoxin fold domain-containing protein [Candidatus Bipolaricaulota bacterium]|nr:thioredoxin fold domain-containing protein [Candidatus Bipolaricaulota bacterium]
MRKYFLIPVLILLLSASVFLCFGEQTENIADNYSFEKALDLSRILDRQLVFSFVSASCHLCQEFEDDILSNPEVRKLLNNHFVLSLVTVDETFKVELPERGEVTNIQLASGLGVKGTPTTFIFYPPDPGLLKEENAITGFNKPPDTEYMIDLLERVVTETFREKGNKEGPTYYNYNPTIKEIGKKDFNILKETSIDIPVINKKLSATSLPEDRELILNFSGDSLKDYSQNIISETDIEKVYLVQG